MKVIPFPGAEVLHNDTKVVTEPQIEKEKMLIGDISFTCPVCMTKALFSTENMIFRSVDYHCHQCGTRHRVSNPCFSDKKTTYKQKKENNL